MTIKTKICIALVAAAVFAVGIFGGAAWSDHRIANLERSVAEAKQTASRKDEQAAAKELEAAAYGQKIAYLERQLAEIGDIARKQDEELENLINNSRRARMDADAARRTRSIAANAAELCQKLAGLGHPCE